MTNLEKLCAYPPGVREMLLNMVEDIDCAYCPAYDMCANDELDTALTCKDTIEAWLEMEDEAEAAAEVYPKLGIIEVGGRTYRYVQTHPSRPEGGGGGYAYEISRAEADTCRLYADGEVYTEAERK